jgi:hypothetical protein
MQVRLLVSFVEEFPGIAVEFCHAQEAVGLIILRRVGERDAQQVHLEALIFQVGRLLEDVVPGQFVPALLEDMGDRLRDDVAAQSHEVAGSRVGTHFSMKTAYSLTSGSSAHAGSPACLVNCVVWSPCAFSSPAGLSTVSLAGIPRMNLELEADGSDFRGNPEAPRPLVAVRVPSGSGAAFWGRIV